MTLLQRIVREKVLITGLVTAFFGMLVAFGVSLTEVQTGSIVTFIGLAMMLLRSLVTPSSEVVAAQKPGQDTPQAGPASEVANGTDVLVVPTDGVVARGADVIGEENMPGDDPLPF